MHEHVEVIVPGPVDMAREDVIAEAERLLAPYSEELWPDDDDFELPAFSWDWWHIGGRWRGAHVDGRGGIRPEGIEPNGIDDWPGRWPQHDMDVCRAEEAHEDLTAATILYADGFDHSDDWTHGLPVKRLEGTWLVTVDIHH